MNREFITTSINIDTLFRNNYENTVSTNYLQELPENIQNVVSMKLVSSEIPNMWYTYSNEQKTNQFIVEIFNYKVIAGVGVAVSDLSNNNTYSDEGYEVWYQDIDNIRKYYKLDSSNNIYADMSHNVILPEGNYMSSDLVEKMNNLFFNTKKGLDNLVFNIDEITGHSIFRARKKTDEPNTQPAPFDADGTYYSPNFKYKINFAIPDEPNRKKYENIGWNLGFMNTSYEANINNIPNLEYTLTRDDNTIIEYKSFLESESIFGRTTTQYIFLEINDFNNVNKNSDKIISKIGDNTYLSNSILARIPITDGSYTNLYNDNSDSINKIRNYTNPVTIKKLHIRLLDKYGKVINLNYNDFSILLEFTSKI